MSVAKKQMKMKKSLIKMMVLYTIPVLVFAAKQSQGLGAVAQNIMEPVSLMSDFVHTACFIIGGSFLFASVIKYVEHRRSPTMVPLGTVVFLVIAGLALILLPFMGRLTESGVPYSLMK